MARTAWPLRQPLIGGDKTPGQVTVDVSRPLEGKATPLWWAAFLVSVTMLITGIVAVSYQIKTGIGTWGLNKTIGWSW